MSCNVAHSPHRCSLSTTRGEAVRTSEVPHISQRFFRDVIAESGRTPRHYTNVGATASGGVFPSEYFRGKGRKCISDSYKPYAQRHVQDW